MVGLSGAGINMVLLYLLVDAAHLHYLMAAAVATEAAIVSNFAFNDRWTFRDALGDRSWAARLWRYNAVALGGLAISLVVFAVLYQARRHPLPAGQPRGHRRGHRVELRRERPDNLAPAGTRVRSTDGPAGRPPDGTDVGGSGRHGRELNDGSDSADRRLRLGGPVRGSRCSRYT